MGDKKIIAMNKLITATHLAQWAETKDGQNYLPELVAKLIRSSVSNPNKFRFPSGDSTYLPGWDGILDCSERIYGNIQGLSLWEFGCTEDVKGKANGDYSNRKDNTHGFTPSNSIFVFVTPRRWTQAEEWVNEKKQENFWKDVIVLTAIELEDWLARNYSVAVWLAKKIGMPTNGLSTVELEWEHWSAGENIQLKPTILLGKRRMKIADEIISNLDAPSIKIIQSQSRTESLAFCLALLLEKGTPCLDRCIVIKNEQTLTEILDCYEHLIIITDILNVSHRYATSNGHTILYATCIEDQIKDAIELPPMDRESFIASLQSSGLDYDKSSKLYSKTCGNITILRRELRCENNAPAWTKSKSVRDLIPAILIGQWYDNDGSDDVLLFEEFGINYKQYSTTFIDYSHIEDSPLCHIDNYWKIISPFEALIYLADRITTDDWQHFETVFKLIFEDTNPEAIERYKSSGLHFWSNKQLFSGRIKDGILNNAILISWQNSLFPNTPKKGDAWINEIVMSILKSSNLEWWLSFDHQIPLMAEAAPQVFLDYVQQDLYKSDSIIKELFTVEHKSDVLFGDGVHYTNILFALEKLAWDEHYLSQVTAILFEIVHLKNESNYSNTPINTLSNIYNVWFPQTYVDVDGRNSILNTLSKKYPNNCFELCVKLLKSLRGTVISAPKMKWRLSDKESKDSVTWDELYSGVNNAISILTNTCDMSDEQIINLIDLFGDMNIVSVNRQTIMSFLTNHQAELKNKVKIYEATIKEINHHKSFPNAKWSLPQADIKQLEVFLKVITPENVMDQNIWLFTNEHLDIPEIRLLEVKSYEETHKKILEIRGDAIRTIQNVFGINGVYEFSQKVQCPKSVGEAYAVICDADGAFENVLLAYKDNKVALDFVRGFYAIFLQKNDLTVFINHTKSLKEDCTDLLYIPLTSIAIFKDVLAYINSLPKKVQNQYWENVNCWLAFNSEDETEFVIGKFNEYRRFDCSLQIIELSILHQQQLSSSLIFDTIKGYLSVASTTKVSQYVLSSIIEHLDKRADVKDDDIVPLEFLCYDILKQYADDLRFNKAILTSPELMMDLLTMVYAPESEEKRQIELEKSDKDIVRFNARLSLNVLYNLDKCPCVDSNGRIDENGLRNYVDKLIELGEKADRKKVVYHTIGHLLANYPESQDFPNTIICSIIQEYDSTDLNQGYRIQMFNKRGVTSRPCFSGGFIEKDLSEKYKGYADKIRYFHPVVAKIFDNLSEEYACLGKNEDNKDRIEEINC